VFGKVIAFLGGPPAAPVFMMLMGLSFAYSTLHKISYRPVFNKERGNYY
jgi:hypothetical protein